jgi:sirohydrochlorin ferrochelatase
MTLSAREAAPAILLVDNGSLEPAATLSLRDVASRLAAALSLPVEPVSLLHSDAIPAGQLASRPAETLVPALERRLVSGVDDFLVAPLFFGPSGALTGYLPGRIALLKTRHPRLRVRVAPPLVDAGDAQDTRMADILASQVRAALPAGETVPAVILVDHGSPVRSVTQVRDHLASQLQACLGHPVPRVLAASMERRPGPDYAFNEPLLEDALDQPGFNTGTVIVALLFLSPGRHAGPGGDIAGICAAAERRHPALKTIMTRPVGSHPGLIPILVDRIHAGLGRPAI